MPCKVICHEVGLPAGHWSAYRAHHLKHVQITIIVLNFFGQRVAHKRRSWKVEDPEPSILVSTIEARKQLLFFGHLASEKAIFLCIKITSHKYYKSESLFVYVCYFLSSYLTDYGWNLEWIICRDHRLLLWKNKTCGGLVTWSAKTKVNEQKPLYNQMSQWWLPQKGKTEKALVRRPKN